MNPRLTSGSPVSSLGRSFEIRRSAIAVAVGVAMLSLAVPGTAQTITVSTALTETQGYGFLSPMTEVSGETITVTSTGSITTTASADGILLLATGATGNITVNETASTGNPGASINGDEVTAFAEVASNIVTNAGVIQAAGNGISLQANSSTGELILSAITTDSGNGPANTDITNSGVSSAAAVVGNVVSNSGAIIAGSDGIVLSASSSTGAISITATATEDGSDSGNPKAFASIINSEVTAESSVSDNRVTNSGSVAAAGNGISLSADSNTGSITLSATASDLEDSGSQATIRNSPVTASTLVENNVITNSGAILAGQSGISLTATSSTGAITLTATEISGAGSAGGDITRSDVFVTASVSDNEISNSGSISAGSHGIVLMATTTSGAVSESVTVSKSAVVDGNTINNSGSITSVGTGIFLSADNVNDNTINVSGSIISSFTPDVFTAVQIDGEGSGNTLNISAPAYLAGEIKLDSLAEVAVNLTSGPSNSVSWSILKSGGYSPESVSLSGPVPWFVNDTGADYDVYATIDPSAFAAANNVLADLSGMTSTFAMRALDQSTVRDFWFSPYGSKMDYDGDGRATLEQKQKQSGAALGYTQLIRPDLKIGGMLGYGEGTMKVGSRFASSYDNKTEGAFAGIYGRWLPADKRLWVDFAFTAGRLSHKDSRFVNDNLVALGASTAAGSYDSTWFSPEIKLVGNFPQATGFTLNPSLQLRYAMQKVDGYTETGTSANASVGSRDVAVMEARAELAGTRPTSFGNYTLRGGYWYRSNQGDSSVRVTMIGDTKDVSTFYSDLGAGYAGLDMNFKLGQTAFFSLGVNGMLSSKVSGGSVVGTLNVPF